VAAEIGGKVIVLDPMSRDYLNNLREMARRIARDCPMSGDAAISVRNLSFSYDGSPVLQDVDLDVAQGDFVSIIGPNGGGKTTLLRIFLGLLVPQRGRCAFWASPRRTRASGSVHAAACLLDTSFPVTAEDVVLMAGWVAPSRPVPSAAPIARPRRRP